MKTLGEKIRYIRNLKGWSQEEIADKLNISLPAYSKIERNRTDVGFSRLTQIAEVLDIKLVDLLSLSTNNPQELSLQKLLAEKEKEIIMLQHKIIDLLEMKTEASKRIDGNGLDENQPRPSV